ncbi:hypothetical protein ACHAWF_015192 [Thalassiosira exigua]
MVLLKDALVYVRSEMNGWLNHRSKGLMLVAFKVMHVSDEPGQHRRHPRRFRLVKCTIVAVPTVKHVPQVTSPSRSHHLDRRQTPTIHTLLHGEEVRVEKWIVPSVDDQQGHGHSGQVIIARRAPVIVDVVLEPVHTGDERVLELADGRGRHGPGKVEEGRGRIAVAERVELASSSLLHRLQEVARVDRAIEPRRVDVLRVPLAVERRAGDGCSVDVVENKGRFSQLAQAFDDHVGPQREAREVDRSFLQANIRFIQFFDEREEVAQIVREAEVITTQGVVGSRAAATAKVDAGHVEPLIRVRSSQIRGQAGVRVALQAVDQDHQPLALRRMIPRPPLPGVFDVDGVEVPLARALDADALVPEGASLLRVRPEEVRRRPEHSRQAPEPRIRDVGAVGILPQVHPRDRLEVPVVERRVRVEFRGRERRRDGTVEGLHPPERGVVGSAAVVVAVASPLAGRIPR